MTQNDCTILRDLAKHYVEVCSKREINERRDLWRRHNSPKWRRPLIYVRAFAWKEMPESQLVCEDLTRKIGILRQIPNLRRIAVSPFANTAKCAEQIGDDYVLSYRPSPADMVGYGFDTDRILAILRRDLTACKACHTDITLKDVETVQCDPNRVRQWVALMRQVIDEVFG